MEAMCRSQSSGAAVFCSMVDYLVAETALAAERSLFWLLLTMVSISRQTLTPVEGHEEIYRILAKSTQEAVPENRDDGESDDNDDEDDDNDDGEEQEADGGEEDYSGDENDNERDENDDPEANGEGGSEEEDDEEDDEDDEEDDEDEEDEEDDEDDEELPQPPTKKRK